MRLKRMGGGPEGQGGGKNTEAGVTLIEVLTAIVILSIIIVPLTNALIVVLRNTDDVNRRLNESHDIQIATGYFAQDVQSVGVRDWAGGPPYKLKKSIEVNQPAGAGDFRCGSADAVVRLAWDAPTAASGTPDVRIAAYVVEVAGTERQLRRLTCTLGSTTPTSTTILAHNLDPATPPTIACASPTACGSAPNVPLEVTLTLTVKDPTGTGNPLTAILIGKRRQT